MFRQLDILRVRFYAICAQSMDLHCALNVNYIRGYLIGRRFSNTKERKILLLFFFYLLEASNRYHV